MYQKIVVDRRGGWCHETNALFCWLLREIGFEVDCCESNSLNAEKWIFRVAFDHLCLVVTFRDEDDPEIKRRYLTDVGWGTMQV